MQEYGFIPNVGMTTEEFWHESDVLATENKMDPNLAYMYQMIDRAGACHRPEYGVRISSPSGRKSNFTPVLKHGSGG